MKVTGTWRDRSRAVHDFQRRHAAPCPNVSESTDELGVNALHCHYRRNVTIGSAPMPMVLNSVSTKDATDERLLASRAHM